MLPALLECKIHYICKSCVDKRSNDFCHVCNKTPAPSTSSCSTNACTPKKYKPSENPEVHVFVDNSNIWIQAQKLGSHVRKFTTELDPRIRIEMGKLFEIALSERPVASFSLYGSRPPNADSLWQKVKDLGIEGKIFDKSHITGREKRVDTEIVHDIDSLIFNSDIKKSTIILVSGDLDFLSVIKSAVKNNWNMEVLIWSNAIAKHVKNFCHARYTVRNLDENFDSVTFISNKLILRKIKYSNSAIVVEVSLTKFYEIGPNKWLLRIEDIVKHPVMFHVNSEAKCITLYFIYNLPRPKIKKFMDEIKLHSPTLFLKSEPKLYDNGWEVVTRRSKYS